jgi:hypothetical protein
MRLATRLPEAAILTPEVLAILRPEIIPSRSERTPIS